MRSLSTPPARTTVLIVEDEPLIRMHAVDIALEAGFDIVEASSAGEALALLDLRPEIGIVFTDIHLAGDMDGLQLSHAISRGWPPIRILLTSGHRTVSADDMPPESRFLPKPYSEVEVAAILKMFDADWRGSFN